MHSKNHDKAANNNSKRRSSPLGRLKVREISEYSRVKEKSLTANTVETTENVIANRSTNSL